jgi:hypothetical protein
MRIAILFVALCVLCAVYSANAIFEEQAGEFDWKLDSIGMIERSVAVGSSIVVTTEEGALASLDQSTGSIKWRAVLPRGSRTLQFMEIDGQLVTVTSNKQGSGGGTVVVNVRGWSAKDGSLLWDTLINTDRQVNPSTEDAEVVYSATSRQLTVLHGNALHFITLPHTNSASSSPDYWTWSASSDAGGAEGTTTAADPELVLSSLVPPSSTASVNTAHSAATGRALRIAVGCYRPLASQTGHCDGPLVLLSSTRQGVVTMERVGHLSAAHTVAPAALLGAVDSDAGRAYQQDDAVLAISTSATGFVWGLANGAEDSSPTVVPFPGATAGDVGGAAHSAARAFMLLSKDGALQPAGAVCTGAKCRTAVLRTISGGHGWALEPVVECSAASGPGSWAAVLLSPHRSQSRVVAGAQCVRTTQAADGSLLELRVGDSAMALEGLGLHVPYPSSARTAAEATPLLSDSRSAAPLSHLALLPGKRIAGKGAADCSVALAVLATGQTVLLRPAECGADANNTSALWTRQEALARVQQAIIVDNPVYVEPGLAQHAAPTLHARLTLQAAKVRGYGTKAVSALQRVAAHVQETVQELVAAASQGRTPRSTKRSTNRDVDKLRMFGFDKTAVLLSYSDELKG